MLSSTGGGLQPSIFASVKASRVQGSNMASLFSDHSSAQPVTCVSGSISPAGDTTYALASPSGSIHLIYLPPPNEQGTTSLSAYCWSSMHCLGINKVHGYKVPCTHSRLSPCDCIDGGNQGRCFYFHGFHRNNETMYNQTV